MDLHCCIVMTVVDLMSPSAIIEKCFSADQGWDLDTVPVEIKVDIVSIVPWVRNIMISLSNGYNTIK